MRRSPLLRLPFLLSLAVPLLCCAVEPSSGRADQWTSLAGTSTVSGEMVGLWNGRVLLQLEGGRRVSVRMEDLRADSRIQAEKRLAELQEQLHQRRNEIRTLAEEAAAPAPKDSPELPAPPSYQLPEPGQDLRTALIAARDQMLAGHPRVYYDTLPATHQKLVDELVAVGLAKLNTASFESARATLEAVADLIVTRQRWLFSYPRLTQLPQEQQDGVLDAARVIAAVSASDALNLQALRTRPFSRSVAILDDAISPHLHRLSPHLHRLSLMADPSGSVEMIDFEVEPGAKGSMIAKLKGTVSSTTYTPFEGRWIEAEDAEAAANRLKELRKLIELIPDDSLRLPATAESVLQRVNEAVSTLRQAATRQEFHRALDSLLPEFIDALNEWSGFQTPNRYANQMSGDGSSSGGEASMDSPDYDPNAADGDSSSGSSGGQR